MKEKILEILIDKIKATPHDYYPTGIEGIPQSAREIAGMVKEFIEWMTCNHVFRATNYSSVLYTIYSDCHEYTLDELFNYWYDNIYKSTDKWNNLK
jgi:hypothetical protein